MTLNMAQVQLALNIHTDMVEMTGKRTELDKARVNVGKVEEYQVPLSGGGGGGGRSQGTVMTMAFGHVGRHPLEQALQHWAHESLTKAEVLDIFGLVMRALERGHQERTALLQDMGIQPQP